MKVNKRIYNSHCPYIGNAEKTSLYIFFKWGNCLNVVSVIKIRYKRNLVGHQRTQYARSYICDQRDYCDKCSWVTEHILVHTSEHPYPCNLCDFFF